MNQVPEVTTERVAMITFLLCQGRHFRTTEVMSLLGLGRAAAYKQMAKMARVLPLILDDDGEWMLVRPGDLDDGQDEISARFQEVDTEVLG